MGSFKSMAYAIFCVVMSTFLLSIGIEACDGLITELFGSVLSLAFTCKGVMMAIAFFAAAWAANHVHEVSSERNIVVTNVAYMLGTLAAMVVWVFVHLAIAVAILGGAAEVYFTYILPQLSLWIGVGAGVCIGLLAIGTFVVATKRWYRFCNDTNGADNSLSSAVKYLEAVKGTVDESARAHRVWARRFVVAAIGYGIARALQADLGFSDYAVAAWTLGISVVLLPVIHGLHKPSTVTTYEAKKAKEAEAAKLAEEAKEAKKAGRYDIELS